MQLDMYFLTPFSAISPPPFFDLPSTPVVKIFLCGSQYICDQAGANSFVSISESEALTFLQDHGLTEREGQRCVFSGHYHFL